MIYDSPKANIPVIEPEQQDQGKIDMGTITTPKPTFTAEQKRGFISFS